MNKIVPILTLSLAVATFLLALAATICATIALSVPQVGLIAVPTSIVGLVAATFFTPFAYLFKKSLLCRIAFFVDLVSLALAVAAVAVAFSAL